jgi:hypothetical protein
MTLVCRICGYDESERRTQGCVPGDCRIPQEVGKRQEWCLMNVNRESAKCTSTVPSVAVGVNGFKRSTATIVSSVVQFAAVAGTLIGGGSY